MKEIICNDGFDGAQTIFGFSTNYLSLYFCTCDQQSAYILESGLFWEKDQIRE